MLCYQLLLAFILCALASVGMDLRGWMKRHPSTAILGPDEGRSASERLPLPRGLGREENRR
ncbi:hypothetical protein BHE74_00045731, partial [Ensete ventricosum]